MHRKMLGAGVGIEAALIVDLVGTVKARQVCYSRMPAAEIVLQAVVDNSYQAEFGHQTFVRSLGLPTMMLLLALERSLTIPHSSHVEGQVETSEAFPYHPGHHLRCL